MMSWHFLYLAQAGGTGKNRGHLLGLTVEVKLLAVFENLSILLISRAYERRDTVGHCELIFTRHNFRQSLRTRSDLFFPILLGERVPLLSVRARCTDLAIERSAVSSYHCDISGRGI